MERRGKVIKRHQRDGRKKKGILKRKEEGKNPFVVNIITVLQRAALKQTHAGAQHQAAQPLSLLGHSKLSSSTGDPGAAGRVGEPVRRAFKRPW